MTSTSQTGPKPARRPRDSGRSRELLLTAASELFSERGFDRTTTREIGERAGVDAALIARYFGNKTKLYIAVMQAQSASGDQPTASLLNTERLRSLLGEGAPRSAGPVLRAVVLPHDDADVQQAARAQLYERVVGPLRRQLADAGVAEPELRAEVAAAALTGIVLARTTGTLSELAQANPDHLVALVRGLLTDGLAPGLDIPPG